MSRKELFGLLATAGRAIGAAAPYLVTVVGLFYPVVQALRLVR